jgi:hypothetical protein
MPSIAPRDGVMPFAFGLLIAMATLFAQDKPAVPYPDGFRSWTHVKSLIVGPDHESFAKRGGIHHYYANDKAVAGYRTGAFPDGSIVVDEAVFMKNGEGRTKGLQFEGDRRFLDVMVKDSRRYGSTGGWGLRAFRAGRPDWPSLERRAGCVLHLSLEGADGPRVQSDTAVRPHTPFAFRKRSQVA